ncbi:MAG TPA: hypothetical protein VF017_03325 [Thermoanaerobaculia bacterium]|nr:hypothetical protein [Thermoanaerobaculia bacterium]
MNVLSHFRILGGRSLLLALALVAGVVMVGCNGATTSIGLPAASPWNTIQTVLTSPYDDLTVVTTGSNISAGLFDSAPGAVCTSDQGSFFVFCDNAGCNPPGPLAECINEAPSEATNVGFEGSLPILYGLGVSLDRPAFTAGGVEIQSVANGTVGAIAIQIGNGTLDIGAAFNEGLLPAPPFNSDFEAFDSFTLLALGPSWEDFGNGYVCTDGTTTSCNPDDGPEGVLALCEFGDFLLFRVNAVAAPVSLTCGSVTVNLNVNPPFDTVGECISTLKAQKCAGLKGSAKAACNHAQIGVCHAAFNVPSSHTN